MNIDISEQCCEKRDLSKHVCFVLLLILPAYSAESSLCKTPGLIQKYNLSWLPAPFCHHHWAQESTTKDLSWVMCALQRLLLACTSVFVVRMKILWIFSYLQSASAKTRIRLHWEHMPFVGNAVPGSSVNSLFF